MLQTAWKTNSFEVYKEESSHVQPFDLKEKASYWKSATKTLGRLHRHTGTGEYSELNMELSGYGAGTKKSFWKWRVSVSRHISVYITFNIRIMQLQWHT